MRRVRAGDGADGTALPGAVGLRRRRGRDRRDPRPAPAATSPRPSPAPSWSTRSAGWPTATRCSRPRLAGFVLDAFAGTIEVAAVDEDLDRLTEREREVMRLIARGYAYKEVAKRAVHLGQDRRDPHVRGAAQAPAVPPPRAHPLGLRPPPALRRAPRPDGWVTIDNAARNRWGRAHPHPTREARHDGRRRHSPHQDDRTVSSSGPSPGASCSSTRSETCSGRGSTSSSAWSPRPSAAPSGSPSPLGVTVAAITGSAYAELVTKYPQAAGASLYVNKAFGNRPLTFLITVSFLAASMAASGSLAVGFASYFATCGPVRRRCWCRWCSCAAGRRQLHRHHRVGV